MITSAMPTKIEKKADGRFTVHFSNGETASGDKVLLAPAAAASGPTP